MSGVSFEATLDLWSASLREVKRRMRPLFAQGRSAENAGLFLDGLLGDERRKTGWMRAEAQVRPTRERPYAKTISTPERTLRRLCADSRRRQHPFALMRRLTRGRYDARSPTCTLYVISGENMSIPL